MSRVDAVVALAALFARERAAALLARLPSGGAAEGAAAARLCAAPRRERLHALALALGGAGDRRAGAEAAARLERPRVAAVLLRAGEGAAHPGGLPPLLRRLCRERIGG